MSRYRVGQKVQLNSYFMEMYGIKHVAIIVEIDKGVNILRFEDGTRFVAVNDEIEPTSRCFQLTLNFKKFL